MKRNSRTDSPPQIAGSKLSPLPGWWQLKDLPRKFSSFSSPSEEEQRLSSRHHLWDRYQVVFACRLAVDNKHYQNRNSIIRKTSKVSISCGCQQIDHPENSLVVCTICEMREICFHFFGKASFNFLDHPENLSVVVTICGMGEIVSTDQFITLGAAAILTLGLERRGKATFGSICRERKV